MSATIKDIARETGLALATISKYINGGTVRPQNKKQIDEAIRKLNYVPRNMARLYRPLATATRADGDPQQSGSDRRDANHHRKARPPDFSHLGQEWPRPRGAPGTHQTVHGLSEQCGRWLHGPPPPSGGHCPGRGTPAIGQGSAGGLRRRRAGS